MRDTGLLREILIAHEGLRLDLYKCPAGKWTIAVGRNVQDNGITKDEAELMLSNDIAKWYKEASKLRWFSSLNEPRQIVIICMIHNMGFPRFCEFKRMFAALEIRDFASAATEMIASRWAQQVPKRAVELAMIMKTGGFS
jgi:lysozyme